MTTRIFIPQDSNTISVGADKVCAAIGQRLRADNLDIQIVRNGSRGLFWLEPMVEVETDRGRVAYGPVTTSDISSLFEHDFLAGGQHALYLGKTESIAYLKNQERLCFKRMGLEDPLDIERYCGNDGYQGLQKALSMSAGGIVDQVTESGLRGRGGAAFPTGIKWKTVSDQQPLQKYVVCNADEGDSGTFSDRMLMEGDPFQLIEGMTIAALAVGATRGYIYLRSEYPYAERMLNAAIRIAAENNWLGDNIRDSGKSFELEVRRAAGAYICGEETSLLESLEGRRGLVRFKPPLPAIEGLFGKPTVLNNVITFASVPAIMQHGGEYYKNFGIGRSTGTLPFQLAGNIKRGGLVEKAFGLTLGELIYDYGGGTISGRPVRSVQVGGPLGAYIPASQFDTSLDYEAFIGIDAMLGHGGVVVFDDTVDMAEQAEYAMEFCALESCGKCTPCRIGSTRGKEVISHIRRGTDREANIVLLEDLCDTMQSASLCALGSMTPYPVMSALNHFPQDFNKQP